MVIPDHLELFGEVFEEGTKGDYPESVPSHEDIPLTNSTFIINSRLRSHIDCKNILLYAFVAGVCLGPLCEWLHNYIFHICV